MTEEPKINMLEDVQTVPPLEPPKGILSGFTFSTYIYLALGVLVIALGVFAEIEHLKIKDVEAKNANLSVANQIQQQTINKLQQANVDAQNASNNISAIEQDDEAQLSVLIQKLQILNDKSIKDPKVLEAKINEASDLRVRCFALVTGAPLKKNETNKVCPQVIERLKHEK